MVGEFRESITLVNQLIIHPRCSLTLELSHAPFGLDHHILYSILDKKSISGRKIPLTVVLQQVLMKIQHLWGTRTRSQHGTFLTQKKLITGGCYLQTLR